MTRMLGGDSVPATTRAPHEWNRLSAPCQCGWMMAGIRSSSTCQTSPAEPMAPTTLRLYEYRFMPTAAFVGYTSLIASTQKMNYRQSLSYTCPLRTRSNKTGHSFICYRTQCKCTKKEQVSTVYGFVTTVEQGKLAPFHATQSWDVSINFFSNCTQNKHPFPMTVTWQCDLLEPLGFNATISNYWMNGNTFKWCQVFKSVVDGVLQIHTRLLLALQWYHPLLFIKISC